MDSSIYRNQISRGVFSRVARQLRLSPNHVCEVAKGNRRSARVETAIRREFSRIDQAVARFERKRQQGKTEVAA
jgi:hypothetical protein